MEFQKDEGTTIWRNLHNPIPLILNTRRKPWFLSYRNLITHIWNHLGGVSYWGDGITWWIFMECPDETVHGWNSLRIGGTTQESAQVVHLRIFFITPLWLKVGAPLLLKCFISRPNYTHRPCAPGLQHWGCPVVEHDKRKMSEYTVYTQCFLVWDSEFPGFRVLGFRI